MDPHFFLLLLCDEPIHCSFTLTLTNHPCAFPINFHLPFAPPCCAIPFWLSFQVMSSVGPASPAGVPLQMPAPPPITPPPPREEEEVASVPSAVPRRLLTSLCPCTIMTIMMTRMTSWCLYTIMFIMIMTMMMPMGGRDG